MEEKRKEVILLALGETSALFMSQKSKGTDIIMPEKELIRIADKVIQELNELDMSNVKQ